MVELHFAVCASSSRSATPCSFSLFKNDDCAIARSNEAKALGITMGAPWHQVRDKLPDASVVALSANFTLYGDMSSRLMLIAAGLGPEQEIYSIDESFRGFYNC